MSVSESWINEETIVLA